MTLQWQGTASRVELALYCNQFEDYIFLRNSGDALDETPIYFYEQADAAFQEARLMISAEIGHRREQITAVYLGSLAMQIQPRLIRLRDAPVLLGHKNGQITTHYSAAEIGELIEAVEKVSWSGSSAPTRGFWGIGSALA